MPWVLVMLERLTFTDSMPYAIGIENHILVVCSCPSGYLFFPLSKLAPSLNVPVHNNCSGDYFPLPPPAPGDRACSNVSHYIAWAYSPNGTFYHQAVHDAPEFGERAIGGFAYPITNDRLARGPVRGFWKTSVDADGSIVEARPEKCAFPPLRFFVTRLGLPLSEKVMVVQYAVSRRLTRTNRLYWTSIMTIAKEKTSPFLLNVRSSPKISGAVHRIESRV